MVNHLINATIRRIAESRGYYLLKSGALPPDLFYIILKSAKDSYGPAGFGFVQIGASDGVSNDPIHDFIVREELSGLFVEPLPDAFERLKSNYQSLDLTKPNWEFAQVAVTEEDGPVSIYRVSPRLEEDYRRYYKKHSNPSGVSSLDYNHVESFLRRRVPALLERYTPEECIECVTVEGMTIRTLFARYGVSGIGLLQIDTEGYDFVILRQVLDTDVAPCVLNFEYKHLKPEEQSTVKDLLLDRGYCLYAHRSDLCAFRGLTFRR